MYVLVCTVTIASCIMCNVWIASVYTDSVQRALIAEWYKMYGSVDTRDTCAVSRYFLLLRYIVTYWRYWYRQVGIDDKYRGIVGITYAGTQNTAYTV